MTKGRTTGDRLDGANPNPEPQKGKQGEPVKLNEKQEDEVLQAVLKGVSEKKIKALIEKMLREGE
jgi:hypothetical protein